MVIFTITRASGLEWRGKLDVLWEVYFQIVAAEVGLILVSMTAFRALFVSRSARKQQPPQKRPSLWTRGKSALKRLIDPRQWPLKYTKDSPGGQQQDTTKEGLDVKLPNIPGGTMTGMRTFISHQGEVTQSDTELSTYETATETSQDNWPFSKRNQFQRERYRPLEYSQRPCSHCGQPITKDS